MNRSLPHIAITAAIGALCAMTGLAYGHDAHGFRFDAWCCQGNDENGDCQRVPDTSVSSIPGGVQISLMPGDHPMVTRPQTYQMEQGKVRFSPDGRVYACLHPDETVLRCLYMPPNGS